MNINERTREIVIMIKSSLFLFTFLSIFSCSSKSVPQLYCYDNKDAGKLIVKLLIEDNGRELKIYTPKHRLSKFLTFPKAALARMFSKNMFFDGSLLTLKVTWKGDTALGFAYSVFGLYNLKVVKLDDRNYHCYLLNSKNEIRQEIFPAKNETLANYKNIIDSAEKITQNYFFDYNSNSKHLGNYFEKLKNKSDIFIDDLEFVAYSFIEKQQLPFSHFGIFKLEDNFSCSIDNPTEESKELDSKTYYLKVQNFTASSKHYENAIKQIQNNNYTNLIIDLRDNSGGFFQPAYYLASYLVPNDLSGGYFLSNQWYKKNNSLPTPSQINSFRKIDSSIQTIEQFLEILANEPGCELKFYKNPNAFKGAIYLLTNNNTASTAEPFVYGVGILSNTTIIGEKTSGSMLSSRRFDLPNNFLISLPTANYFTSDGKKLDKVGVKPDIETTSDSALSICLETISKKK